MFGDPLVNADVCVVVPARDARETLPGTLSAIAAQDVEATVEVIVVDDGSRDRTGEIAASLGARVLSLSPPAGPALARNAGAAASAAGAIAFTDADCLPSPAWLRAGLAALADADLVQGAVTPQPGVARGPFDHTLSVDGDGARLFESANLLVRRELWEALGGFEPFVSGDEGASRRGLRPRHGTEHFGEDVVLGWRAVRSGARVTFAPDALVVHRVVTRGAGGYVAARRRLRYFPALLNDVPELRGELVAGTFLTRRTAAFDAGVVAVLAALLSRRAWPLVGVLPYARLGPLCGAGWWRRPAAYENAVRAAADLVGLVSLLEGSVAARRAVL